MLLISEYQDGECAYLWLM